MVNEVNKPPPSTSENAQLEDRLANSNRQLQAMQEEHEQLLQEMETLRQRAAELSQRSNAESSIRHETSSHEVPSTSVNSPVEAPGEIEKNDSKETNKTDSENKEEDNDDDDDPGTVEYLNQKLAEVAALKARLKRVHNMIETTNNIEQHIARKEQKSSTTTESSSASVASESKPSPTINEAQDENEELLANMLSTLAGLTSEMEHRSNDEINEMNNNASSVNVPVSTDENQELLSTMLNMFTDFTADLRSQSEHLRAERERIKALKEELIRRKRGN